MRIVIDMQGAQTESRFRGIGRYTLSFSQAVVRNRGEHEVILALSNLFPETIAPIRSAFKGLLPQECIRVWSAPGPVKEEGGGNKTRREIAELIREAFLANLQPDIVHICSLFEGYVDDAITSIGCFDRAPLVSVTLHDLIPLLYPEKYLTPNPQYEAHYYRKLDCLDKASIFLAVSESSRKEVMDCRQILPEVVVNTGEGADAIFRILASFPDEAAALNKKIGITLPFVLYTGGADERKNLPRLIEAWSTLPDALRQSHHLLFAGRMPDGVIAELRRIANTHGLKSGELLFSGYVSDEELVWLYNSCKLYVFPSWHEGFGLPALEAMACGAPIIGADAASLPEVINLEEALFDPFDVIAIGRKLSQVLKDEEFLSRLRAHGSQQSKKFDWDKTAKIALKKWQEMLPVQAGGEKIVWKYISRYHVNNYERLIESVALLVAKESTASEMELQKIAACIAENERQVDISLRPRSLPSDITWRIEGPFDSSYSLALVNREIARALAILGHRVILHSTEGPGDFLPSEDFLSENNDLAVLYRRSLEIAHEQADVVSRNLYPPRVKDMAARFNFLHAYGWEESGFPQNWVDDFNSSLQGMTVMSEHVRKIMIAHGVTVPVEVSCLGVDHWDRVKSDTRFKLSARSFRFLHVSSCFPRKGVDVMLRAYGRAFRSGDDVTLIIKTFKNPHNEVYRWLKEARENDPDYPDVVILETDYSDGQLKALYEQCQVLVAPSRAEGFGLPMAEAMLSGLAVITTGWGGQTDFCTHETAWLVDYSFSRAKTHFNLPVTVWADPDEAHLKKLMQEVYQTPEEIRQLRITAGQRLLEQKFKWSAVAARMVDSARHWSQFRDAREPCIGWVTTWKTRCGIATYSENLIKNIPAQVKVLAASAASIPIEDEDNVVRCWEPGEHESLIDLSREIERLQLNTVVVQFNYGFFELGNFAKFLNEQVYLGRVVVVMMHSTSDPKHVPHKKLSILAAALAGCSLVMVHTPGDMNRLKNLGVIDNVIIFPHGVLDCDIKIPERINSSKFKIASYGFFLAHKGLLELIDAIHILRGEGWDVALLMINSEYPIPESKLLIDKAREKISAFNIQQHVEICSDYLEDEESIKRLGEANLIVFPYQNTGESSSAAVRYGLAAGRPVAVTPNPIFDDVSQVVHFLPGASPNDIAKGILECMQNIVLGIGDEVGRRAEHWRAGHRYSLIGGRLYGVLCALLSNRIDSSGAESEITKRISDRLNDM